MLYMQDDDTDEFLAGAATRHDELGRDFMQLQARFGVWKQSSCQQ
jgi:hypothetical protein